MRMEERAEGIRAEIAALPGERGPGNRYPAELRERIVEYWRLRRKQKVSTVKISGELGIGIATLRSWTIPKKIRAVGMSSASFERVEIVNAQAITTNGPIVVRGPGGICVEGLDIDNLAKLIQRLS
jgi:hypothetical protein